MGIMSKAAAVTVAALVLTSLSIGSASADEDTWTYWGDGVPSGTGERSTSFTTKNDGDPCVVTLRVKKYPDVSQTAGWLEPTAEAVCRTTRRGGTGMALRISANGESVPLAMVPDRQHRRAATEQPVERQREVHRHAWSGVLHGEGNCQRRRRKRRHLRHLVTTGGQRFSTSTGSIPSSSGSSKPSTCA